MKETIEKRGTMRSCSLSKDDLVRMHKLVSKDMNPPKYSEKLDENIEVTHKGITHKFNEFEAFLESYNLPAIVHELTIRIRGADNKHVWISFKKGFIEETTCWVEGDEQWVLSTYEGVKRIIDERRNLNWLVHHWLAAALIPFPGSLGITWLATTIFSWRYGPIPEESPIPELVFLLLMFSLFGVVFLLQREYPYSRIHLQDVTVSERLWLKLVRYIALPLTVSILGVLIMKALGL